MLVNTLLDTTVSTEKTAPTKVSTELAFFLRALVLESEKKSYCPEYGSRLAGLPGVTDLGNGGGIAHGAGYRAPAKPKNGCPVDERDAKSVLRAIRAEKKQLYADSAIPAPFRLYEENIKNVPDDQRLAVTVRLSGMYIDSGVNERKARDNSRPELYPPSSYAQNTAQILEAEKRVESLSAGEFEYGQLINLLVAENEKLDALRPVAYAVAGFEERKRIKETSCGVCEALDHEGLPPAKKDPRILLDYPSLKRHPLRNRIGRYFSTGLKEGDMLREVALVSKHGRELRFSDEVRKAGEPDQYDFSHRPQCARTYEEDNKRRLASSLSVNPLGEVNNWLETTVNPKTIEGIPPRLVSASAWREKGLREIYDNNKQRLVWSFKSREEVKPEPETFLAGPKGYWPTSGGKFLPYDQILPFPKADRPARCLSCSDTLQWFSERSLGRALSSWNKALCNWVEPPGGANTYILLWTPFHSSANTCIAKVKFKHRREKAEQPKDDQKVCLTLLDGSRWEWTNDDVRPVERNPLALSETDYCSSRVRAFMQELANDINNLKRDKPMPKRTNGRVNWVVRLKKKGQITLSENGKIRTGSGTREKRIVVTSDLTWTAALTHCNLAYREFKTQATEHSKGSKEFFHNMQEAADWEAKGLICQLAGGTTAPDFELEPSRNDPFGASRIYVSENVMDQFRTNDTKNESEDDWADHLGLGLSHEESYDEEPLSAFSAGADPRDIENGSVFPKGESTEEKEKEESNVEENETQERTEEKTQERTP